MNCDDVQQHLSAYLDEEVSETEYQQIDAHLNTCAACKEVLSQLHGMQALFVREFGVLEAPGDMESRVLSQLLQSDSAEPPHHSAQLRRLSLLFGAVVLTASVVIVSILISPLGLLMRAGYHLLIAMAGGFFPLSGLMGTYWIEASVVFFILLASLSLYGLIRLLRAAGSEVLL